MKQEKNTVASSQLATAPKGKLSPQTLELLGIIQKRKKRYLEITEEVRKGYFAQKLKDKQLTYSEVVHFNMLINLIKNL